MALPECLSSSVSSALSGLGLPPCQHHRLLRDQRAQGRAEAVQTGAGAAGLLQIAGETVSPSDRRSLLLTPHGVQTFVH